MPLWQCIWEKTARSSLSLWSPRSGAAPFPGGACRAVLRARPAWRGTTRPTPVPGAPTWPGTRVWNWRPRPLLSWQGSQGTRFPWPLLGSRAADKRDQGSGGFSFPAPTWREGAKRSRRGPSLHNEQFSRAEPGRDPPFNIAEFWSTITIKTGINIVMGPHGIDLCWEE